MNENLNRNLFFNTLITKYNKFYDAATEEGCLIVVPSNKYLKFVNINENLMINHILKPSKLLKSHYTPYFKKCSIMDVEVENDFIFLQRDGEKTKDKIKIIGEEIAYNENNKLLKILLVEKPLVKFKINHSQLKDEPLKIFYFTFIECQNYLYTLSPVLIKEIKEKIDKFLKTYLILPDYLDDAAIKLKGLIDWSVQKYSKEIIARFDEEARENLILSLECFIIELTYDKTFPVVKSYCLNEEQELTEQLKKLEKEDFHFTNIGCNTMFRSYEPSDQIYECLNRILRNKSPFRKICNCKLILDKINDELNFFLDEKLYSSFSKSKYEILTDDLIAILVYILIKFYLKNLKIGFNPFLISEFKYINIFSFYLQINSSVYGYSLTTFEVALSYIKDFHLKKKIRSDSPSKSLTNRLNNDLENRSLSKSSLKNGSIKNLDKRKSSSNKKSSNEINEINEINENLIQEDLKKQFNFSSFKINEDLEKITKLIEDTSFSFQQLENAEKE